MGLRFSIKWALAAMAYAALAAAALTQDGWAYTDLLWLATFLAFAYAVLLACFQRGPGQARAVGFAVVSFALACCMLVAPENLPTQRVLTALGVIKEQIVFAPPQSPQAATGAWFLTASPAPNSYAMGSAQPATTLQATFGPTLSTSSQPAAAAALELRAANALATMFAGLVGCVLGALAYRQSRARRDS
jgi:hypothetical protein